MQIFHHGARAGVISSCHQLVTDAGHNLLIACGLFQGTETSADGKSDAERLAIDISASGRIVNYPRPCSATNATNVLLVGYQAKGAPGQITQHYSPRGGHVDLDGQRIAIRVGIETHSGYSVHADRKACSTSPLACATGPGRSAWYMVSSTNAGNWPMP